MCISVIICSRQEELPQQFIDNINGSVGCEYELCLIDNSRGEYNIFTAYNEGVKRAKGDILCFMHEDVLFHSYGWGQIVCDFFRNHPEAGLMGVVGGQFIPDAPAYWGDGGCDYGVILQGKTDVNGCYQAQKAGNEFDGSELEVVAVDGQWFCIPRALFDTIRFDDKTFSKFHGYDMDICMQIATAGKKLFITNQILVEHKSFGSLDADFVSENELFYNKWKNYFPIVRGTIISAKEIEERTRIVRMERQFLKQYIKVETELKHIRQSRAYRLGKFLLRPVSVFKR